MATARLAPRARLAPARPTLSARLVLLALLGGSAGDAAARDPAPPAEEVLREVVLSLHASSVEPPDLARLGDQGLAAIAEHAPCLKRQKRPGQLKLTCHGRAELLPWPPQDGRQVAALLSRALHLTAEAPGAPTVQQVARALAAFADDPYTAYLPPEMVDKLEAPVLATPGIELAPRDPARIREVRPGSDAARAGLKEGDRLVEIDGTPARDLTLAELSARLSGPPNTALPLVVRPGGGGKPRHVVLLRTLVPEPVVNATPLVGDILYIRLSAFAPGAARKVAAAVWEHRPRGLVLDLRHNQGGLIAEGIALLDLFFEGGNIGGVKPRPGRPADAFAAGHQPSDIGVPLVVLIDGGSASAAELVALVLKERKRATVLGSPSIGKGSVQKVIRLPDGGVLRVTSAHYTGPSGRPLPKGGVRPDRYLAPPAGRTVLEGGNPEHDSWVLAALDVLEGTERASASPKQGRIGPEL